MALWEAWVPAARQPLAATRWIGLLDADADDSLAARLWRVLAPLSERLAGAPRWTG